MTSSVIVPNSPSRSIGGGDFFPYWREEDPAEEENGANSSSFSLFSSWMGNDSRPDPPAAGDESQEEDDDELNMFPNSGSLLSMASYDDSTRNDDGEGEEWSIPDVGSNLSLSSMASGSFYIADDDDEAETVERRWDAAMRGGAPSSPESVGGKRSRGKSRLGGVAKSIKSRSRSPFRSKETSDEKGVKKPSSSRQSRKSRSRSPLRRGVDFVKSATKGSRSSRSKSGRKSNLSYRSPGETAMMKRIESSDDMTQATEMTLTSQSSTQSSVDSNLSFDDSLHSSCRLSPASSPLRANRTQTVRWASESSLLGERTPSEEEVEEGFELFNLLSVGETPSKEVDARYTVTRSIQQEGTKKKKKRKSSKKKKNKGTSSTALVVRRTSPYRTRTETPAGLQTRPNSEDIITQLSLGSKASKAVQQLRERDTGITDPKLRKSKKFIKVAGVPLPDYTGYVERTVTSFRRQLGMSDGMYEDLKSSTILRYMPVT